jgi:predicted O-methyltransferase YrrM
MTTAVETPLLDRLRAHREGLYAQGFVPTRDGKQIPTFPTGITAARGEQLCDLFRAERPARTIETGLALGLSTLFILEASLSSHDAGVVHHTAIDPFQASAWGDAGVLSIDAAGLGGCVRHLAADSALALPALAACGERFDAGFVDGSHLFEGAFTDILYMMRLVRPGGLIVLDDYWMPAVRAAAGYFAANMGVEITPVLDEQGRAKMAALRTPEQEVKRAWDHFVPFATQG